MLFVDQLPADEARELLLDVAEEPYRAFDSASCCPFRVSSMPESFRAQWTGTGRAFD